jgi:hypothetical protein
VDLEMKMLKKIYIERIEMGLKNGMFGILVFWKNTHCNPDFQRKALLPLLPMLEHRHSRACNHPRGEHCCSHVRYRHLLRESVSGIGI